MSVPITLLDDKGMLLIMRWEDGESRRMRKRVVKYCPLGHCTQEFIAAAVP